MIIINSKSCQIFQETIYISIIHVEKIILMDHLFLYTVEFTSRAVDFESDINGEKFSDRLKITCVKYRWLLYHRFNIQ